LSSHDRWHFFPLLSSQAVGTSSIFFPQRVIGIDIFVSARLSSIKPADRIQVFNMADDKSVEMVASSKVQDGDNGDSNGNREKRPSGTWDKSKSGSLEVCTAPMMIPEAICLILDGRDTSV
jgi:hypothetical protein